MSFAELFEERADAFVGALCLWVGEINTYPDALRETAEALNIMALEALS